VLRSTSNFELAAYFADKQSKIRFGGVFSNDELRKPKPNHLYILNLENASEGGSHWTLLLNHWYFDSYGTPPTKTIAPFVKQWNKQQLQSLESEACGFFVLYVADRLMAGLEPYGELRPMEEEHNENVLEAYFAS